MHVDILGVRIISRRNSEVLEYVLEYLKSGQIKGKKESKKTTKPLTILTPNAEIIVYARKDKKFMEMVNRADLTLPDGIGVVLAARIFYGKKMLQKIAGVDFMAELCAASERGGFGIGLIGGRDNLALETLDCLRRQYNRLRGWAEDGPEIRIEDGELKMPACRRGRENGECPPAGEAGKMENGEWLDHIVQTVQKENTRILFVAFGHPKQEYLIDALGTRLKIARHNKPIVLMAVGGSFDLLNGRIPRAPVWIRELGLEWLYRLGREPWRIKRQMALPQFILLVMKERFTQLLAISH